MLPNFILIQFEIMAPQDSTTRRTRWAAIWDQFLI